MAEQIKEKMYQVCIWRPKIKKKLKESLRKDEHRKKYVLELKYLDPIF